MLLKKEGFPERDEFVLCTVTNIQFHSVFVDLDEYVKPGMIHISEISPGRIRNIRDFVKEGKKVVCLVLRINTEKGHIDLSLRRVNESQKRNKINQVKQEQLVENIIEHVAKKLNLDVKTLFNKVASKVKDYPSLYHYFESIVSGESSIKDPGLSQEETKLLDETIKQRIKLHEVEIRGALTLKSYSPDGVDVVKAILTKAEESGKGNISILFTGGGKYKVSVKSSDYKNAEKILEKSLSIIETAIKKDQGDYEFVRAEKK